MNFHPIVEEWFRRSFSGATPAQVEGWPEIEAGRDVLISAPTGSGKTLAAFLVSIDRLVRRAVEGRLEDRIGTVYVSPLKAPGNDTRGGGQLHPEDVMLMVKKPYLDYFRFQRRWLIAIALVGLPRKGLSIAGLPNSIVQFASMTVLGLAGTLTYGLCWSGFGTYRHLLLPLAFHQTFLVNTIAVVGIGLFVMGTKNIYDAPEFIPPFLASAPSSLVHALAHLFIGNIAGTLVAWGVASLAMAIGGGARARS
jgi:hypothetical protein